MKQGKIKFPIRTFIFVVSLFFLSFSASYSYFTAGVTSSPEEERTSIVTTDYLDVNFTTSSVINNSGLALIKPENVATQAEKTTFTIGKKDGITYSIKYNIYLTEIAISDNLKTEDFKWDLLQNGVSVYNGTFASAVAGEDFMLTAEPLLLSDATSADYELRIWLEETDVDQSELFNGSVSAKVGVDVYTVARSS